MAPVNRDRLQRALDGVDALAIRIKQDREISVDIRNVLLTNHVAGDGFLQGRDDAHSQDQSLFVNGDDNDNDDDPGYEEENAMTQDEDDDIDGESSQDGDRLSPATARWLNGLAPYIVSNRHRPICCRSHALTDCSCTAKAPRTTEAWLPHSMSLSRY